MKMTPNEKQELHELGITERISLAEDSIGTKGIMYGQAGSTSNLVKVILNSSLCQQDTSYSGNPCPAQLTLTPGVYKIYTNPWGTPSNQAIFTIY